MEFVDENLKLEIQGAREQGSKDICVQQYLFTWKPKGFKNLTSQPEALAVWTIHLGQRWISGGPGRNHVPNIGLLAERFLRIAVVSLSQSMQRLTNTPALRKFEGFHWL